MGMMGGRSVSPLSTDPHPDPNPTLLPRAPTPDPEPTSTPPAATHGTGRGVVMGVKGDRSDSACATVHADPAPIPILGQGEVSQAQLCQPPPTRHPHMVHDHGHISTAGIVLYVVLYTLLADAPVHVSLCMWGMWATVAWGMSMVGPSLITAATRACKCVHNAYMAASDKQLKVFLALLAVSVLFLCPWAAAPSSGFSSQFLTAHSTEFVVCSATTSVNVVGVFNSFVGTGINDATRITVGPDTFADVSLISPTAVNPAWKRVSLPPMGVTGIGGRASITDTVQIPLQLQWGAQPVCVHVYAYVA